MLSPHQTRNVPSAFPNGSRGSKQHARQFTRSVFTPCTPGQPKNPAVKALMIAGVLLRNSHGNRLIKQSKQKQSACIGPNRGPVQAKMAEIACMGPDNGPVRALREIISPGTAQTLNRSTFGAQRLRLQANGGFCRRVPPSRGGI